MLFALSLILAAASVVGTPASHDPAGDGTRLPQAAPSVLQAFDYDRGAPLEVQELSQHDRGNVVVHDITFASPLGGRVPGYLVTPTGKGRFAGILFLHAGQGNRTEFLAEAILLARAGAVSLLIDAPFMRPQPRRAENDLQGYVQMVVDCRRGIDLLTSRSDVDPRRIAFVGHSLGATWGAALGACDRRVRALVLMAGYSALSRDFRTAVPAEQWGALEPFAAAVRPFDAVDHIASVAPAPVLFQYGRDDRIIGRQPALNYERAAREPKALQWYDGGHELNDFSALVDRAAFLGKHLGIAPVAPLLARAVQSPAVPLLVAPLADRKTAAGPALGAFDYDRGAPLDVREVSSERRSGAVVRDITFASPMGGVVPAYLVAPPGKGRFAGIVFMHWGEGNRTEFLSEAMLLARAGAVSILLDAPFVRPDSPHRAGNDPQAYAQMIVECRRAVDVLASRPEVDPARIAYVGHSLGATWGAAFGASEPRLRALVLMAGLSAASADVRAAATPERQKQLEPFLSAVEPFDAVRTIGAAAPAAVFLQFASDDRFITRENGARYERAAGEPKLAKWYDGGHELNDVRALADRAAFLRDCIGIADVTRTLQEMIRRKP